MERIDVLAIYLLTAVLTAAVFTDLRYQKIPNWLTLPTIILGCAYHIYQKGFAGFLFSIEGAIAGVALLIIPYLMGGMGAGDAKLMGSIGALLGPKGVFIALLLTALIGGIYALGILVYQGFLWSSSRRYWGIFKEFLLTSKFHYIPPPESEKSPRLRYGVAIALGTLLSVFMKSEIIALINFK
jgi:prepilin peptidase CpaA